MAFQGQKLFSGHFWHTPPGPVEEKKPAAQMQLLFRLAAEGGVPGGMDENCGHGCLTPLAQ